MSLGLALMLAACATTTAVLEWQDETYTGGRFHNVLIIGISKNHLTRRVFEDSFVKELRLQNVNAVSSATVMPGDIKFSPQTINAAIARKDFDGVLITHLVGVREEEVYYPPTYTPVFDPYYGHLHPYYSHVYDYVYEPGYYTRYKVVKLETNLYESATGKLVWSMQSETIDPADKVKVINAQIRIVMEHLRNRNLI